MFLSMPPFARGIVGTKEYAQNSAWRFARFLGNVTRTVVTTATGRCARQPWRLNLLEVD